MQHGKETKQLRLSDAGTKMDRVESLACDLFTAIMGGRYFETSTVPHLASTAIAAAKAFYDVWDKEKGN
jgi:hypothetical protein